MIINPCIKFHSPEDEQRLIDCRLSSMFEEERLLAEWKTALDTANSEQDIQDFLERHPELLPGLYDLHNGPLHGVIVSKFPFGADYKCDFAFVTRHSMALQFTFIEIKDPKIAVFNKDGSFTKAFNRARLQIADWQIWVEKNLDTLMNMFSPMFDTYNAWNDRKDFRFYLMCGRRNDVEADPKRKERWSGLYASSDRKTIIMSFDRLHHLEPPNQRLIVCTYQDQSFYAKPALLLEDTNGKPSNLK